MSCQVMYQSHYSYFPYQRAAAQPNSDTKQGIVDTADTDTAAAADRWAGIGGGGSRDLMLTSDWLQRRGRDGGDQRGHLATAALPQQLQQTRPLHPPAPGLLLAAPQQQPHLRRGRGRI